MSRCESRNPVDPNMQCAASEGHTWEHRFGGIAWADEAQVPLLLLHRFRGDPWGPCSMCDHPANHRIHTEAALQRPTPKLPLFDSGNPNLSAEADAHFGPGCPPPESSRPG